MGLYSVVDCAEEYAAEDENFDINTLDITATAQVRCAYASRHALISDVLINRYPFPKASDLGNPPRAYAASCKPVKGTYTTTGQSADYVDALVTIKYSTKHLEAYSEELEPTAEFLKQDHRLFKWADNGDPLLEGEAPGKKMNGMNLARTIFRANPPLPPSLLTLPGYCNAGAYASATLGLTFASETLLFGQPKISRTIRVDGAGMQFKVAMRFTFKSQGWNKFWRAKTQAWTRILLKDGTAYFNHPLGDFSAFLF